MVLKYPNCKDSAYRLKPIVTIVTNVALPPGAAFRSDACSLNPT